MLTRYVVLDDWSTYAESGYIVVLGKVGREGLEEFNDFKEIDRKICKRIFHIDNPNHLRELARMIEDKELDISNIDKSVVRGAQEAKEKASRVSRGSRPKRRGVRRS